MNGLGLALRIFHRSEWIRPCLSGRQLEIALGIKTLDFMFEMSIILLLGFLVFLLCCCLLEYYDKATQKDYLNISCKILWKLVEKFSEKLFFQFKIEYCISIFERNNNELLIDTAYAAPQPS